MSSYVPFFFIISISPHRFLPFQLLARLQLCGTPAASRVDSAKCIIYPSVVSAFLIRRCWARNCCG
jgi:hypothetical protein